MTLIILFFLLGKGYWTEGDIAKRRDPNHSGFRICCIQIQPKIPQCQSYCWNACEKVNTVESWFKKAQFKKESRFKKDFLRPNFRFKKDVFPKSGKNRDFLAILEHFFVFFYFSFQLLAWYSTIQFIFPNLFIFSFKPDRIMNRLPK